MEADIIAINNDNITTRYILSCLFATVGASRDEICSSPLTSAGYCSDILLSRAAGYAPRGVGLFIRLGISRISKRGSTSRPPRVCLGRPEPFIPSCVHALSACCVFHTRPRMRLPARSLLELCPPRGEDPSMSLSSILAVALM